MLLLLMPMLSFSFKNFTLLSASKTFLIISKLKFLKTGFKFLYNIDQNIKNISLDELPTEIEKILKGNQIGRVRVVYD